MKNVDDCFKNIRQTAVHKIEKSKKSKLKLAGYQSKLEAMLSKMVSSEDRVKAINILLQSNLSKVQKLVCQLETVIEKVRATGFYKDADHKYKNHRT